MALRSVLLPRPTSAPRSGTSAETATVGPNGVATLPLAPAPLHLVALTPPRDVETPWESHVRMVAGLCGGDPRADPGVALEIAGHAGDGVRFLARAADRAGQERLKSAFNAFYPHSLVVDVADAAQDPARVIAADAGGMAREFRLRTASERPLATELAEETPLNILGLVGTLYRLPAGMTALVQLILWPAPAKWGEQLEDDVEAAEARARAGEAALPAVPYPLLGALIALAPPAALVYLYLTWLRDGRLLLAAAASALIGGALGFVLWRLHAGARPPNARLARAKLAVRGFTCRLRVGVAGGTADQRVQVLDALAATLAGYSLPNGNGFVATACDHRLLHQITARGARRWWRRPLMVLNARGAASLFLPPGPETEVPGVQRQTPRLLFPTDPAYRTGLHVGNTETDGLVVPVHLPVAAVDKGHMAVIGSTGGGKSVFLQRLLYAMAQREDTRPQLIVLDPHHELVRDTLSWYPVERERQPLVIRLDDPAYRIGYNPLDVSSGRSLEQVVGSVCTGFARYWEGAYGPRMDDVLRRALETFYLVNTQREPERQLTLLDINPFLQVPLKRAEVLREVQDFFLLKYWRDEFGKMTEQMFEAVIKPVLTKLNRFTTPTARQILAQRRSTINMRALVRSGVAIFVDLNFIALGEDTCGLLGSLLINDVCTAIGEALPSARDALVVVDEFQMFSASWDTQFQALRKRGGRMVVASQGLSVIERVQEGLCSDVLNNTSMGTKVIFSAGDPEEAATLARVLDDSVTAVDVQNLPVHTCYIKTTDGQRKLPVVTARVPLPPRGAPGQYDFLARCTNRRYGTPVSALERARAEEMRRLYFTSSRDVHADAHSRDAEVNGELAAHIARLARDAAARDGFSSPVPGDGDGARPPVAVPPGSTPLAALGSTRPGRADAALAAGWAVAPAWPRAPAPWPARPAVTPGNSASATWPQTAPRPPTANRGVPAPRVCRVPAGQRSV